MQKLNLVIISQPKFNNNKKKNEEKKTLFQK